jgi:outer membrane protein insertion porin family
MMRRSITPLRGLALGLILSLAGCAAEKPPVVASPKAAPVAERPPPPCPETILPGGDPLEAGSFEGKPVVRVCVVGGTEESRKGAQRAIELRPTDLFSADRVRGDLQALVKLGTFDDVSAHGIVVQQGAGVVILYAVHDRPRVADLAFEGAKVLGDASLNAKLPSAKDIPYDPAKINPIALAVRDEYRSRGYDSCRVVIVAEPVAGSPGAVHVRMKVDEGPLSKLTKVDFRGNKRIPEADLRKVAGLKVGQPYVQNELERASLMLTSLYYDRGFVMIRIASDASVTSGSGEVPLTFVIDEGPVHTIGKLRAVKLGIFVADAVLEKVMRTRPKQVFSRSALVEDIQRLKAHYESRGEKIEVNPLTEVDPKTNTIDLTLEIGPAEAK